MPFWNTVSPTDCDIKIKALIEKRHFSITTNTCVNLMADLIVDDNEINQDVVNRYLQLYNIKSDTAFNGLEVLEKLVSNNYNVIWLDMKMPVLDGIHTSRILRAKYPEGFEYRGKIVGTTGYVNQESHIKCIKAGMDSVITKPYSHFDIAKVHGISELPCRQDPCTKTFNQLR